MNNTKPLRKISIKIMILAPVIILGLVTIISNTISLANIKLVNSSATSIADEHMAAIEHLATVQEKTQDIHSFALSHIIAADFDTMLNCVNSVEALESEVEQDMDILAHYIPQDDSNYKQMIDSFNNLKVSIRTLMAYSANTQTSDAYAIANGDVSTYSDSLRQSLDAMSEIIQAKSVEARNNLSAVYSTSIIEVLFSILISVIAVIFAIVIVLKYIVHPIVNAEREIKDILIGIEEGHGDLTKRITISADDEIASLGKGINKFMEKLQQILALIIANSEKMDSVVSEVLGSVHTSSDSASDLSAVTEELSATMQEVGNNANSISSNADEVNLEVNEIATVSSEINEYSKNMKAHADSMEHAARTNMQETNQKVNEILEALNRAVEDSKSVDQVNTLTNDILNISSQTNLLALNASIEAARAGEAGKGFAVVAGEISNLADSSRDAANHIQEINGIVTEAVHNLSEQASGLIEYMQGSILPTFENFVEQGDQYKQNASYIEEKMDDFTKRTDSLKAVVADITSSLGSIAEAIDEGVKGVSGAAESTQTLVYDMDNITSRMDENQKIALDLKEETSIFRRL